MLFTILLNVSLFLFLTLSFSLSSFLYATELRTAYFMLHEHHSEVATLLEQIWFISPPLFRFPARISVENVFARSLV